MRLVPPLLLVTACSAPPLSSPAPASPSPSLPLAEITVTADPKPKFSVHGTLHRIELGGFAVGVDAGDGARIVEYSFDGFDAMASKDESPLAYGTSFWPSPQSDWGWPPPPEIDRMPWTAGSDGDALVFTSETNAALGLRASERVTLETTGSLRIDYALENRGSAPRKVAPWQNTRVRPRGLTFYPSRGKALPPSTLEPTLLDGVAWLLHDPATMKENQKSFADGAEGFLAHAENRHLLVKVWDEVPRERQAPGEAEVELYVDKTGLFVEIEQQGPYEELAPDASLRWTVRHALVLLDSRVEVAPGSPSLLEAARSLARRLKAPP